VSRGSSAGSGFQSRGGPSLSAGLNSRGKAASEDPVPKAGSEAGSTLLDWFKEKEKSVDSRPVSRASAADWGGLFNNEDEGAEEVVPADDQDSVAEMMRFKEEARIQAAADYESRVSIQERRHAEMDLQALKRREAQDRRKKNEYREEIRDVLIERAGSAREAYAAFDVSQSGRVSLNEFDGGVRGMNIDWQSATGLTKIFELFKLFDHDKKGFITFANLFPLDAKDDHDTERMSTPEFLAYWFKKNKDLSTASKADSGRDSKWGDASVEQKLTVINNGRARREDINVKKKWMRGMIHRLKSKGKSDARCREIVAQHLPRGTGPRDEEGVNTFISHDVNACRKDYADKVQESVRNIEKTVFDMHDQRRKLHTAKQQLWAITEEPLLRARALEDQRSTMNCNFGGMFSKKPDDE